MYGLTYYAAAALNPIARKGNWVLPTAICLYVIALTTRLFCTGASRNIGLTLPQKVPKRNLVTVFPVLLSFPIYNFWIGGSLQPPVETILFCICVSLVEEIFFRGVLFRFFLRLTPLIAILLSSLLFALLHGVNFLQGNTLIYVLTQMACTFGAGVFYAVLSLRYRSLLFGIVAHSLTNITGIGLEADSMQLLPLCFIAAGCTGYGLFLYQKMQNLDIKEREK